MLISAALLLLPSIVTAAPAGQGFKIQQPSLDLQDPQSELQAWADEVSLDLSAPRLLRFSDDKPAFWATEADKIGLVAQDVRFMDMYVVWGRTRVVSGLILEPTRNRLEVPMPLPLGM